MQTMCIIVALLLPSAITLGYFVLAADSASAWQQGTYTVGKMAQFLLPLVWVFGIQRRGRGDSPKHRTLSLWIGLAFGLVVAVVMVTAYHLWLRETPMMTRAADAVREKISGFAINSTGRYLGLAVFYCCAHSLFEEYYWRWFVFGQLRDVIRYVPAIVISSLGFMAHHVIVLGLFFGWDSPTTYLFSTSVAVGGAVWAWIYARSGSLIDPWLSHLILLSAGAGLI